MSDNNVIPMHCLISKKLRNYIQGNFLKEKKTEDDYSILLLSQYFKRLVFYHSIEEKPPFTQLELSLGSKPNDDFSVNVLLKNSNGDALKIEEDKNFSRAFGYMYAKDLLAAYRKSIPLIIEVGERKKED